MGYQIIADTDYLLDVSKKINDTSKEIANSLSSMKKISSELCVGNTDPNMQNFNDNFCDYLTNLNNLSTFYESITSTIDSLSKEYDSVDNDRAIDLKRSIDNVESNS